MIFIVTLSQKYFDSINQTTNQLFTLQYKKSDCLYYLSSNRTLCVQNCQEIGEVEFDGQCITMVKKTQICADDACCSSANYGESFVWDAISNQCICTTYCTCKSEQCCQQQQGPLYHYINNWCQTCYQQFGLNYEWDGQQCSCPQGSECFCRSNACCQKIYGNIYLVGKCQTCATLLGPGYEWISDTCTCPSGKTCTCATQFCCKQFKSSQIFINGECATCSAYFNAQVSGYTSEISFCECNTMKQVGSLILNPTATTCISCQEIAINNQCVTCAAYGSGYVWKAQQNRCYCPPATTCVCTSEQCCSQVYGKHFFNDKCMSCTDIFGDGAVYIKGKCVCNIEQQYIGTLTNPTDTCKFCNGMYQNGICKTCTELFGPGYGAQHGQCYCMESDQTLCSCQTELCCNQQQLILFNGSCKQCTDIYGISSLYSEFNQCKCNSENYGKLTKEGDKCVICQGVPTEKSTICKSCEEAYGTNYIWDSSINSCKCKTGVICTCKTELCCNLNGTHFMNNKCTSCIEEVGYNYMWSNDVWTTYPSLPLNQCICLNPVICKCLTDYCCSLSQQTMKDGVCQSCQDVFGAGFAWNSEIKKCACMSPSQCSCDNEACCNQISKGYQGSCVDCNIAHVGSIFSAGKCTCDSSKMYVGQINKENDKCTLCPELISNDNSKCQSCSEVYGSGAIFDSKCVCDQSTNYVGTLPGGCTQCSELIQNNKCVLCSEIKPHSTFNSGNKKCECDLSQKYVGVDSCVYCPELISFDKIKCESCEEKYGIGAKMNTGQCECNTELKYVGVLIATGDKCTMCQELMSNDKKTCRQCDEVTENSVLNLLTGQCDCESGFKLKGNKCTIQTNKTGLAVGVPLGLLAAICIGFFFFIICKKKHKKDEEDENLKGQKDNIIVIASQNQDHIIHRVNSEKMAKPYDDIPEYI
ncbi:Hypothetical_protein [Hexamita inflata]|uniref:Hypothetical_protein n=1 Tax=Hexamita inflata TaxID=28002 RepID=A0AA86UN65_9EUKA|nr:Hypothetical protein HINF_LOCUS52575 [Hexamita inflata]